MWSSEARGLCLYCQSQSDPKAPASSFARILLLRFEFEVEEGIVDSDGAGTNKVCHQGLPAALLTAAVGPLAELVSFLGRQLRTVQSAISTVWPDTAGMRGRLGALLDTAGPVAGKGVVTSGSVL